MSEWPNSTIPEWLREFALNPADYHGAHHLQTRASSVGWVSWEEGKKWINLDGDFTAQQLREIADMMEGTEKS